MRGEKVATSLILLLLIVFNTQAQEIDPLFDFWQYYSDHENALYLQLTDKALSKLEKRKSFIKELNTVEEWQKRKSSVQEKLNRIIGPFPQKTPLHPRLKGTLKGDGFTVEKIVLESQPGFFITSALFLPDDRPPKAPAVIYCSGHTFEGFRSEVYQHMIINLVKKGFIVFAFDPIGQGERLQYLDEKQEKSIFRTPTHEHSYPGGQCFITGSSLARHMIWDGIRSVDYLVSRPEVDPARIAITGRSGGGTQSAYIAAMDDRIEVAAPECYITSFEYLLRSIGPQDAEQNIPLFLKEGLDHADLLEVRMPKPTLIISTTDDFFSIQGARETFKEVKQAYTLTGYPENIDMTEDDAGHASTLKNREALYAFLSKHMDHECSTKDEEVQIFSTDELTITETGQLMSSTGTESIYSLNKKEAGPKLEKLNNLRKDGRITANVLQTQIKELTSYDRIGESGNSVFSGRKIFDDYILDKYLIENESSYPLPVFVMKPIIKFNGQAILIFNPEGKTSELKDRNLSHWLVSKGFLVIIPDVTGFGELGPGYLKGDTYMEHTSYNQWFAGILIEKSPVGIRMQDMTGIVDFTVREYSVEPENVYAIARGVLCADLLHTSALPASFNRIALIDPLISYRSMVMNETYHPRYIQSSVFGCIGKYDLPDLAGINPESKLLLVDIRDQDGHLIDNQSIHPDVQIIMDRYSKNKENLILMKSGSRSFEEIFANWLK